MSTHLNPEPISTTKEPLWKRKWVPYAALGLFSLLVGMGIGGAGESDKPKELPKSIITEEPKPTPAPTVTKTVEKAVPTVPEACLRYIDLSEEGFTHAGDAMGYMSEAMTAASAFDVAGIEAANAKLQTVTPKMNELAPKSNAAKAECRAAAK